MLYWIFTLMFVNNIVQQFVSDNIRVRKKESSISAVTHMRQYFSRDIKAVDEKRITLSPRLKHKSLYASHVSLLTAGYWANGNEREKEVQGDQLNEPLQNARKWRSRMHTNDGTFCSCTWLTSNETASVPLSRARVISSRVFVQNWIYRGAYSLRSHFSKDPTWFRVAKHRVRVRSTWRLFSRSGVHCEIESAQTISPHLSRREVRFSMDLARSYLSSEWNKISAEEILIRASTVRIRFEKSAAGRAKWMKKSLPTRKRFLDVHQRATCLNATRICNGD